MQTVKVQLIGPARGMVYAEGRRSMVEQLLPASVLAELGHERWGYFQAEWTGVSAGWQIGERSADENW